MAMTKKDFTLVADAFIKELRYYSASNAYIHQLTESEERIARSAVKLASYQVAAALSEAYPNFDQNRFLDYIHDESKKSS